MHDTIIRDEEHVYDGNHVYDDPGADCSSDQVEYKFAAKSRRGVWSGSRAVLALQYLCHSLHKAGVLLFGYMAHDIHQVHLYLLDP